MPWRKRTYVRDSTVVPIANDCGQWGAPSAIACAAVVAFAACGTAATEPRQIARDVVEASTEVRALAATSCAGLATAVDALERARVDFDAATLAGFVEDAVDATRARCPEDDALAVLSGRGGAAAALARATVVRDRPARALAELDGAWPAAAVLRRRGELLVELGRGQEAALALEMSLALDDDEAVRAAVVDLWVAARAPERAVAVCAGCVPALAAAGRYEDVAAAIAAAPVHVRTELATNAAATAPDVRALAVAGAPVELLVAVAARVREPTDAAALLARAAGVAPDDADVHMAHAEALERAGEPLEAVAAWDRAARVAPANQRAVLAPIRILAGAGRRADALARASALARAASDDADALHVASLAYAYAGDAARAVELARAAVAARPGDGRLEFELALRLRSSGRDREAIDVLARLLVCGARGRPWHRHEVARHLAELGARDLGNVDCAPVEPADLARYVEQLAGSWGRSQKNKKRAF